MISGLLFVFWALACGWSIMVPSGVASWMSVCDSSFWLPFWWIIYVFFWFRFQADVCGSLLFELLPAALSDFF